MSSHLRWTLFGGIGALALLATALASRSTDEPKPGDQRRLRKRQHRFYHGIHTRRCIRIQAATQSAPTRRRRPEPLGIGVIAATIRRERER